MATSRALPRAIPLCPTRLPHPVDGHASATSRFGACRAFPIRFTATCPFFVTPPRSRSTRRINPAAVDPGRQAVSNRRQAPETIHVLGVRPGSQRRVPPFPSPSVQGDMPVDRTSPHRTATSRAETGQSHATSEAVSNLVKPARRDMPRRVHPRLPKPVRLSESGHPARRLCFPHQGDVPHRFDARPRDIATLAMSTRASATCLIESDRRCPPRQGRRRPIPPGQSDESGRFPADHPGATDHACPSYWRPRPRRRDRPCRS